MLIVVGIALLFILLEIYFTRYIYENQIRFVCFKLIKMLERKHVKSDLESMRICYEYYLQNGHDETYNNLLFGNPIQYLRISKYSPETEFSKVIISQELYKYLKKRKSRKYDEEPFLRRLFSKCFDCKDDAFDNLSKKRQSKINHQKRLFAKLGHNSSNSIKKGRQQQQFADYDQLRVDFIEKEFHRQQDAEEERLLALENELRSSYYSSYYSVDGDGMENEMFSPGSKKKKKNK